MPYDGVDPKGPEIERLRAARGWTRSELGRRSKNDYKTIYGIEKGFQRSTRETLQRIATELGVSLDDVMHGKDEDDEEAPPKRTAYPTTHPTPTAPTPPPRPTKSPARVDAA